MTPRTLVLPLLLVLAGCPEEAPPPALPVTPPAASTSPPAVPATDGPPVAPKSPVVDTYQGVSVTDDYRWLENADDPKVKAWSDAENVYARKYLDALPSRAALKGRLKELMGFQSPDWYRMRRAGGRLFALEAKPPKQQPYIVLLKTTGSPEGAKVVLDPNVVDPTGGTSMDWYVPSLEGKMIAVSLSTGGSESGTLHVYDVDTGKEHTADTIPRVQNGTGGGSVTWLKDGAGFYYTRYPAPGERPPADAGFYQQVYFHKLGTDPKTDIPSLTKDLARISEIALQSSRDGRFVVASVANGDGGEFDQWILQTSNDPKKDAGAWRKLAGLTDKIVDIELAPDGELWMRSRKDADRGKILKLAPTATLDKATVVVPESDVVIHHFIVTRSRAFVADVVGGPYQIRVFDRAGKARPNLPVDPVASVYGIVDVDNDDVMYQSESFVKPGAWSLYRDSTGKTTVTALAKKSAVSLEDAEVVRETCLSKDGTKVPMSIVRKKGTKLDGSNKFLLTGYGGYGVVEEPWFDDRARILLDEGVVIGDVNLRGGGEFGESWHRAGNLTQKQHVFDDFIGCAKHVVEAGYTKPSLLAAIGGSNGGLLMGAVLTQSPESFRAIVSEVGIYDMLRVETTPNGAFNVTEFGTVKDKAQFDALFAYSPYHHVKDGQAYPAVLFTTGANDPRVDPYMSRKMTARLQAASPKSAVYLRTSDNTGHGIGSPLDERIDESADVFSFLLARLSAP